MFAISHDIPIPEPGSGRIGFTQTLREMCKGDSVEVPLVKKPSVYGAAHAAGVKIRTRSSGCGTVRVWRTDGPERHTVDTKGIFGQPPKSMPPGSVATESGPVAANAKLTPALMAPTHAIVARPQKPDWPRIERTVGNPSMGLPEGYYIQEGPYGLKVWMEGKPPVPEESATTAKKTIFG